MGMRRATRQVKVAIVDDHPLYRAGLAAMLAEHGSFCVVGQTGRIEDVLRVSLHADILILDWRMVVHPEHLLPELQAWNPDLKVLAISASDDEQDVLDAMTSGACGYLVKTIGEAELLAALTAVRRGNGYVSGTLGAKILS